jgi:predicted methyltransferase
MRHVNIGLGLCAPILVLATTLHAYASADRNDPVAAAVADPARPTDQVAWDARRKPVEALRFAGVEPGARVADFMSGSGYFTRIFSRVVGKQGHVYAFLPTEQLKNCSPEETAGTKALAHDGRYNNVTVLRASVNRFEVPEQLDLVWTSLNFHDLFDPFMGPADVPVVMKSIFSALKPGGVLLVIDHVAAAGSEVRDTNTLHRIDPQVIVAQAEASGFRLEAQSDLLRNPRDTHTLAVFDATIRGRTDQVVLKFRKPAAGAG